MGEVYPAFHPVPFSKMLKFYKTDSFRVTSQYSFDVPYPDRHIGVFDVGDVRPNAEGGSQLVKVKVRINPNGVFGVASAQLVEKHEVEEEVPVQMDVDENKEGGDKAAAGEATAAEGKKEDDKMDTNEAKKDEE